MFQRCVNVLDDSRSHGKLGANDEEWARKMAAEIAKCDAALAK
jgi:hypothetical protein